LGGDETTAIAVTSAGYGVGALTWLVILVRRHHPNLLRPDTAVMRRLLGYGLRAYVATLAAFLVIRVDMLMVNGYLGATDAGLYSVAVALVDGIYLLPTVVAVNLFPRVARGAESAMTAEVFRNVAVLYGAFCLLTVPFAGLAIRLIYGHQFSASTSLFYWLLPGAFALGMITILSHHFAGRGFPLEAMLVWFVGLGVNFAMNIVLLPGHGPYIASLASSVAYALLLALHMGMFAREVGGWASLVPRPTEVVGFVRQAVSRA
jgi:O-antigen/teichoic acid export membrane protein